MKKADYILIAVVLVAAIIYSVSGWLMPSVSSKGATVEIAVNASHFASYPLESSTVVTVPIDQNGHHNILVIQNGTVKMTEANCPDLVCVKSNAISKVGQTIVCLPNRVVVEIKGKGKSEVDDVVQ